MDGFDVEELAARSGVDLEKVRRFLDLGVLEPASDGFRAPDIQLARIYQALDEAGFDPEHIATLLAAGNWSNGWAELIFPDPFRYSELTLAGLADQLGVPRSLIERAYAVWQLPRPGWDEVVREDEAELLRITVFMFDAIGRDERGAVAAARIYSENLRRIADSQARFFRTYVEEPMFAAGVPIGQALDTIGTVGRAFLDQSWRAIEILHARHVEHAVVEEVFANLELALENAGLAQRRPKQPPAIAFLDLTGYTSLTEREGDEAASQLAEDLAEMVQGAASRSGGKVVKLLGDGVMFHFAEAGGAIRCGLDLVDVSTNHGLPPARMGVNSGPVIFRDGDYFGRTVNVAARVADYARPSEVLVTADTVADLSPDDMAFTEIGDVGLKGLAAPVRLFQARRQ